MKNHLKTAKWIWCTDTPQNDEYGEFTDTFIYDSGSVFLRISADSNYAVYLNGCLIACGQYADFPHDKIYDEINITSNCETGANYLAIQVWYYGIDNISTYYPGNAGLLYEIKNDGVLLCQSDETTLSRMSKAYENHRQRIITPQLGYSYRCDAALADEWITKPVSDFIPAILAGQELPLRKRPCKRPRLLEFTSGKLCKILPNSDCIYDLGKEIAGLLQFEFDSPCEQEITISYGEHLADGCVRQCIDMRDFSVSYRAKAGTNTFMNPFRRFACRYLQVSSKQPLQMKSIGLIPVMYEVTEKERPVLNELQSKIYDMCIETLRLCMHEHYEDCPWREQALYAMDSRNQMLCGYYAFDEYEFPRANIELISKDRREDGLLSICYPMKLDFVIPSFSLHYITGCAEYLKYSKDISFIREIYPKLLSILTAFTSRLKDGLIAPFEGSCYWNFYEWRPNLDNVGSDMYEATSTFGQDALLNCLLSIALQNMADMADALCTEHAFRAEATTLNQNIRKVFWDDTEKLCYNYTDHVSYSQLCNALAILSGVVTEEEASALCERMISDKEMTPISLSMVCFKYDAWLKTDKEKYTPIILKDIETTYQPMIDFGSTTVWETELGQADFDNAGSLCHGWSALPIYYYHTLL